MNFKINYLLKGWESTDLIKFIRLEKPVEYDELIKSIKSYIDCLENMLLPNHIQHDLSM
jgi:hypothetical protein